MDDVVIKLPATLLLLALAAAADEEDPECEAVADRLDYDPDDALSGATL